MPRSTTFLVCALCSAGGALAQADWTQLTPATAPSPRAGTQGVTDGANLYIFGGKPGPGVEFNDMWRFDGTNWTDITPTTGALPPDRDFYAAAFDAGRGVYVLFGGRSSALAVNLNDTWEFDVANGTWAQITPATTTPGARRWAAMTYDLARGECIMFGGFDGTYNNETWSWDGADWTLLSPATSPSIRGRGRLSYDLTRSESVYYGGRDAAGALGDTWIWNGTDWQLVTTTTTAPGSGGVAGLFAYGMTYDLVRDRHVIFGGTRTGGTLANTWEFDGTDWEQRGASGPSSRTGCAVAFVVAQGTNYLYGGFGGPQNDETWEYQTTAIASAANFGSGCAGLALAVNDLPWVGDTVTSTISGLSANSLAFSVVGLSNTMWGGVSLPVPASAFHPAGGANCFLRVSQDAVVLVIAVAGSATTSFALPNDPAFAGLQLHQQGIELEIDPALNITSINSTNGVTLTVGAR